MGSILLVPHVCVALRLYSGDNTVIRVVKAYIVFIPWFATALWRMACVSTDIFEEYFSSLSINRWVYQKLKEKLNYNFMNWFATVSLSLNILWAVYLDFTVASWYNACCGLILAFTLPLPASVGKGAPGWTIKGDIKTVDLVAPDFHWAWVTLYTSWNFLFALMYTLEIFDVATHLVPCYLYCLIMQRWDLYIMIRVTNLWIHYVLWPWSWAERLFGEPVIIKDEMVPIVWGSINLFLGVVWTVYYVGWVWRKRISAIQRKADIETHAATTETTVNV